MRRFLVAEKADNVGEDGEDGDASLWPSIKTGSFWFLVEGDSVQAVLARVSESLGEPCPLDLFHGPLPNSELYRCWGWLRGDFADGSVVVYEVSGETPLPLSGLRRKYDADQEAADAAEIERGERDELARLLKKYGAPP